MQLPFVSKTIEASAYVDHVWYKSKQNAEFQTDHRSNVYGSTTKKNVALLQIFFLNENKYLNRFNSNSY